MAIPFSTTTITVLRLPAADMYADPYENTDVTDRQVVSSGVRAVISAGSGSEVTAGGEQSDVRFGFSCDPTDIAHTDWVKDERTGQVYRVSWVQARSTLGISLVRGELQQVLGAP